MLLLVLSHAATMDSSVHVRKHRGGNMQWPRGNPSVYNYESGGYPAKVISDGRLSFPIPDLFTADPFLIERALEKNFQPSDPVTFVVCL